MFVTFDRLSVSAENPRKTKADPAADEALAASMKAHGQIVPVIVRPNGKPDHFEIIEGGRRYHAGQKAGLAGLKCELDTGTHTVAEIGGAANMMRASMHPLDEAAVIAKAIDAGESAADVALRFGQTGRWAQQRHKLNDLCDRAKKLFRNGAISLATAQALTVAVPKSQNQYLKTATRDWQLDPDHIRAHFAQKSIPASAALFSLDLYPAEAIHSDLFSEDVWLTDRKKFAELQDAALQARVAALQEQGWAKVELVVDPDYEWRSDNIRVEGDVKKADRSRFNAFVVYDTRTGKVQDLLGYTTRAELKRAAREERKAGKKGAARPEEVEPMTALDLGESQQQLAAAQMTRGIANTIANGDTWLALRTIFAPLLSWQDRPAWSAAKGGTPGYINTNVMLDDADKMEHPAPAESRFPTRAAFEKMSWDEFGVFIRNAALHCMKEIERPDAEALKILRAADAPWFSYTAAFLRRYRLDALQDLARRLKIDSEGKKKTQLVAAILEYQAAGGTVFCPVRIERD